MSRLNLVRIVVHFYSLLLWREFKPDQYAVLLDFGNKDEGNVKNGLVLAEELDMDPYAAPKQYTPSGGLHYMFNTDNEQANRIGSVTCVTCKCIKYGI